MQMRHSNQANMDLTERSRSVDANDLVKAIDEQMSDELVSKDLSGSDKLMPKFDDAFDGKDPRVMAFAPTMPIHAFREVKQVLESESLHSSLHMAEAPVQESPEEIMIDTSKPSKPHTSKWHLGFRSHHGTDSPFREASQDEEMEETVLSRLQIKPSLDSQPRRAEQEVESIKLAQQLAREEFERDKKLAMEELKSIELIRSLEEEEKKELQKLRDEQEEEEMNEFNCKICFDSFDDENSIFPLQLCEHVFHRSCLGEYLRLQIKESKLPIFCPDPKCKQEISDTDLKDLLDED
jgi:hypothetical protein